MLPNNQNAFNHHPGKIVTGVERFQAQSGQVVEIRRIEMTVLENNMIRKENVFEVEPPLADNRIPDSVADIRECHVCLGLFHEDNVDTCLSCGGYYNRSCRGEAKDKDGTLVVVCAKCAKKANTSLAGRLWNKFWNIRK